MARRAALFSGLKHNGSLLFEYTRYSFDKIFNDDGARQYGGGARTRHHLHYFCWVIVNPDQRNLRRDFAESFDCASAHESGKV